MTASAGAGAMLRGVLRRRGQVVAVSGWALVGAVPTFVSGQAVAHALDDGFLAGRTGTGLAWLGALAATIPLGAVGARQTYLGVARLVEPLRDGLVRGVVESALARATTSGATTNQGAVARLTQHVEIVRDMVAGLLLLVLGFVAAILAALAGLVTLAPAVLPLIVVPLVISGVAFAVTLPGIARQQRRVLLADERLAELADGVTAGLRDVVACGGEQTTLTAFDRTIDDQVTAGRAMARVAATRSIVVAVGARVPVLLVLVASGWLLRRGMSAGALLGALTYLIQGLGPAVSSVVGGIGAPLAQLLVTVERLDDAGTTGTGVVPAPATESGPPAAAPIDAGLVVRDLTFRYRAAAEPVLHNLDLVVPPGDHLAVVGPSGAGKSTLAALLVGALLPQAGTVRHGGRLAHQVDADHRVLIPQEAYVFRGTVDENVRYLRPDAGFVTRAEAAEAVGLDAVVARLGGYTAPLEPGRLSAGERQLVALARAYLSPARLIVLDEATCHLDPTAEADVEAAFAERPGTTLVVVAHRLSSAQRARHVLLMDGDEVVHGTHQQLIDGSPLYRELLGHWLDPVTSR